MPDGPQETPASLPTAVHIPPPYTTQQIIWGPGQSQPHAMESSPVPHIRPAARENGTTPAPWGPNPGSRAPEIRPGRKRPLRGGPSHLPVLLLPEAAAPACGPFGPSLQPRASQLGPSGSLHLPSAASLFRGLPWLCGVPPSVPAADLGAGRYRTRSRKSTAGAILSCIGLCKLGPLIFGHNLGVEIPLQSIHHLLFHDSLDHLQHHIVESDRAMLSRATWHTLSFEVGHAACCICTLPTAPDHTLCCRDSIFSVSLS